MSDQLVVFGCGGHGKVVIDAVLTRMPNRQIILLDDAEESGDRSILGIRVSGAREVLRSLENIPVALGIGDNAARARLLVWLREEGVAIEAVLHPAAVVSSSVAIGPGVFVSAGATIIAEAQIGAGTIINTGASVDHDCVVGEASHIGPGAHLCGNVHIGARTLVGVGSSIAPGISVCNDVVLGAGSVVVRNIQKPGTFVGNPARRIA